MREAVMTFWYNVEHQTSLSTLEKWAEPLREQRLLALRGRWGDWGNLWGWGTERNLWYCSLALAEAMEEGWGAPGVDETTEGEDTEEEEVGGGAWTGWDDDGGAGRAGTGGGKLGIRAGGGEDCLPRSLSVLWARCWRLRFDWLPDLDGFCERSGFEEDEESCLDLCGPPKLWQCSYSSSWLREVMRAHLEEWQCEWCLGEWQDE